MADVRHLMVSADGVGGGSGSGVGAIYAHTNSSFPHSCYCNDAHACIARSPAAMSAVVFPHAHVISALPPPLNPPHKKKNPFKPLTPFGRATGEINIPCISPVSRAALISVRFNHKISDRAGERERERTSNAFANRKELSTSQRESCMPESLAR